MSTTPSTQKSIRVFPTAESPLGKLLNDPEYKAAFHRRLQSSNRFVAAFYRIGLLPLMGAGKTTMLLTTRGRKSGQIRRFPIGYFRIGGENYVISAWAKGANWYKNLQAHPEAVTLQIGWHSLPARAEVLMNPVEIRSVIERLVTESPASAQRLFGWDPQKDQLSAADFSPIVEKVLFVRFVKR
jgi:deazaflavin-dependent oxidoreductase (nitroreductase family)